MAFAINNKGYIGTGYFSEPGAGNYIYTYYFKSFWEYDPATNSWTQKASFGGSGRMDAVGFSIGNKGYIGTGSRDDEYDTYYYNDFWEYDPANNIWTEKANFPGTARDNAVGFSIDGKGYIGTGDDGSFKNDFWEYNPVNDTWLQKANFGGTARSSAAGFSIASKGYIGTGYSVNFSSDFWEYNPINDTWTQKANFGGTARSDAVGFSIACKGYIGTGYSSSYKNDFWEYNPINNTWTQKANFGGTARLGAAGFSIGNQGYIGTGGYHIGYNYLYMNDFWEYSKESNDLLMYADSDGDGYGDSDNSLIIVDCILPTGYVLDNTDCNDTDESMHPGACDNTNGIDDNCDGAVDDGFGTTIYYADADGDGYGKDNTGYFCSNPGTGYSTTNTDCNDASSLIHPDADESDNCIDDNCNGIVDEGYNTWTQKGSFGGTARYSAVGFSINTKGYIGTGYDNTYKNDFWEYDPAANTWTQKANFGGTARYSAVGFSIGTKGYIGTGNDGGNTKDFWEYNPTANTWIKKASLGGDSRYRAVGFSINNKGYIGTGSNNSGDKNDFWEYNPDNNTWTQKANFGGGVRYSAVGFAVASKGYIGTGSDGAYKNDFWEYDPAVNTWIQKTSYGGAARYYATGFSIGNKGYIGCGSSGTFKNDFWEYDPVANTWVQKTNFGGTPRYSAVGFSIGSIGYLGTGFDNANKNDFWEYNPESSVCPLPISVTITNITVTKATVNWTGNACAYSYRIRKRPVGTTTWAYSSVTASTTTKTLSGNVCVTDYEVQVQTYCDADKTDSSEYTASVIFTSSCPLPESVTISDITDSKATVSWTGNQCAYSYRIRKRVAGTTTWVYSSVTAPATLKTLSGNTPATTYEVQVQTYCDSTKTDSSGYTASVNFTSAGACAGITSASTTNITTTSATLNWTYSTAPNKWTIKYRKAIASNWTTVKISGNLISYQLSGLSSNTAYDWKIRAKCGSENSEWSAVQHFSTSLRLSAEVLKGISFFIYPNPANDQVSIQFTLDQSSHINIKVYDASGKEVAAVCDEDLQQGDHVFQLNTTAFSKGVYVVRMISDEGVEKKKLIVQ